MSRIIGWLAAFALVPSAVVVLLLVSLIDRYDAFSYGRHSELIRRLVPWRISPVVALVPLVVLSPFWFLDLTLLAQLGLLLAALVLCEVYCVCFHRESYIAAYEPQWIPMSARPLGRRPVRPSDRRLHYLIRTQVVYVLPLLIASLTLNYASAPLAWVIFFLFVVKYVPSAWIDYEAYFHWDMHCDVLQMVDGQRLSKAWRLVCEWALGPAVGSVPMLYSTEHLVIHHPANAGPKDIHSPLPYSRTSVLEFSFYMWKTIGVLATAFGVFQHPRCSPRQRVLVISGVVVTGVVVALGVTFGLPIGFWLAGAIIYRGANTAMAQYVWHGLHDGSGSSSPLATTILWLPATLPVVGDEVHPLDGFGDQIPRPGADWAFFDNYHLVHHLHPRAHFAEYPALLARDLPRINEFGSPVMKLSGYATFFDDLLARRIERVARSLVSSDPVETRVAKLTDRLSAWPDVRSRVEGVSESVVGSRIDAFLSKAWGVLHR